MTLLIVQLTGVKGIITGEHNISTENYRRLCLHVNLSAILTGLCLFVWRTFVKREIDTTGTCLLGLDATMHPLFCLLLSLSHLRDAPDSSPDSCLIDTFPIFWTISSLFLEFLNIFAATRTCIISLERWKIILTCKKISQFSSIYDARYSQRNSRLLLNESYNYYCSTNELPITYLTYPRGRRYFLLN